MTGKVVILTGAGISAESGIQTFRAADGLWHNHRVEEVASPEGFRSNPQLVHQFYNERRRQLLSDDVNENAAHQALALLEARFSGSVLLVTQNIDDLHERAGSNQLLHMHGELLKMRCQNCADISPVRADLTCATVCSRCKKRLGCARILCGLVKCRSICLRFRKRFVTVTCLSLSVPRVTFIRQLDLYK